jgi:hypothetical protein
MSSNAPPGELPDELVERLFEIARTDEKFASSAHVLDNLPDDERMDFAARMVAACFDGSWRDELTLDSRDRIVVEYQNATRPPESVLDPLRESAERNVGAFDAWTRHAEINDPRHVVAIGGTAPFGIQDTRDDRTMDHPPELPAEDGGDAA